MEKDKLIKLIKLANNNPSEGEANAAARKVCRLLAESDFNWLKDSPTTIKKPITSDLVSNWEDIMRRYRYAERDSYDKETTGSQWWSPTGRYRTHKNYDHVDQTDEPPIHASKEEWEDYYRRK